MEEYNLNNILHPEWEFINKCWLFLANFESIKSSFLPENRDLFIKGAYFWWKRLFSQQTISYSIKENILGGYEKAYSIFNYVHTKIVTHWYSRKTFSLKPSKPLLWIMKQWVNPSSDLGLWILPQDGAREWAVAIPPPPIPHDPFMSFQTNQSSNRIIYYLLKAKSWCLAFAWK